MRVLFTNNALRARAGTELYTQEVAGELKRRGHDPMVFSLSTGAMAEELRAAGIPVVEDLHLLPAPPEVIHGHHAIETTLAAMNFPRVPVLSFCHGPEAWQEAPCRLPNVFRWIAVDEACQARLVSEEGIPAERVSVLLNFVDQKKLPRRATLMDKPRRALVFSNYMSSSQPVMKMIIEACREKGITVEGRGAGFGQVCDDPGAILPEYDLVFAKARCAMEALACGCAVIQADYFGLGHLITSANFDALRRLNFGYKSMTAEMSAAHISAEIGKYDPTDATLVAERLRTEASLEATVDGLLGHLSAARDFSPPDFNPVAEASDFLRFQLFLSKLPLEALRKTDGISLRLPVPPFEGSLREVWERVKDRHQLDAERRIAILEAKLEKEVKKSNHLKERLAALQALAAQKSNRSGWRSWFPFS